MTQDNLFKIAQQSGAQKAYSIELDEFLFQFDEKSLQNFAAFLFAADRNEFATRLDVAFIAAKYNVSNDDLQGFRLGVSACRDLIMKRGANE